MFRYVGPDWRPNPWESLPGLTLASVILALVLAIFGCIVFSKPNIAMTIAVSIFFFLKINKNFFNIIDTSNLKKFLIFHIIKILINQLNYFKP